ncbi:hypothetical protein D9M69_276870 [compost metagenome]
MVSAARLPRNAAPNADIGTPSHAPPTPTAMPRPRNAALRPPRSPAQIASAVAMPAGQVPVAGKILLPNRKYSIAPSTNMAITAPISIGVASSGMPIAYGTPIGIISELAAPKVADEIAVCTRFCRSSTRKRRVISSGMRENTIAISAPMIDVLAEIPSDTISCMPIMAPNTDSATDTSSSKGSIKRDRVAGCAATGAFSCVGMVMSSTAPRSVVWFCVSCVRVAWPGDPDPAIA